MQKGILVILFFLSFTVSSIYGKNTLFRVSNIILEGNKITHDNIIYRELEFKVGMQYFQVELDSLMAKSRENLLNRSLFNFVTITPSFAGNDCSITVKVTERWYIWPMPILDFADPNFNVWWQTKDFNRLNYGLRLEIQNFRGRMERLNLVAQGGYDKVLSVSWSIPYLTKKQFMGIMLGGGYSFNHEVAYTSENNNRVYYNAGSQYARTGKFGFLGFTFRSKFNFLHSLTLHFDHVSFLDTLLILNPELTPGNTTYNYFSIGYRYKQDFRDSKQYPLDGYYFDVGFDKVGFGIFNDDINYWQASFTFDQYINLYKRLFFAYNLSAKYTNGSGQPYFMTSGLGTDGIEIRGYELYVIPGQRFTVIKSNLKYQIIKPTDITIKWIKTIKFNKLFFALYFNYFFDVGYASDFLYYEENSFTNQLLWGTGVGLDVVSYYDIVLRFEYSLNKYGQTNFFIGFVAPI
jgi:hypothetical protein